MRQSGRRASGFGMKEAPELGIHTTSGRQENLVELKTKTEQAKRPSECVPHARVCAAGFSGPLFLPIFACQSILQHMEADCMQ